MKTGLFFLLFFIVSNIKSQSINNVKVDTSNYFRFYSNGEGLRGKQFTIDWLRLKDAIPIIQQEMKSAGYDTAITNYPIKVDPNHSPHKVTLYSTKLKAGFLYIEGHDLFPSKKHRDNMTEKGAFGEAYGYFEKLPGKEEQYFKIMKLPENVLPLNENNYWFQYTNNTADSKKLVTKEIAISILRQDIKAYLAKWKQTIPNRR